MKRLVFGYFFLTVCGLFCFGFGSPSIAHAVTPTYTIPNPPNERLKDFSVIEDNGTWHAFAMSVCVSAPCVRPYSVIWHYISRDLHTWTNLGVVLTPRAGTIDADDVWAPTVVKHGATWKMFYTAVQYQGNFPIQRIAVATSSDLLTWNRTSNNLAFDCDAVSWAYWNLNDVQGIGGECRDPFIIWNETDQRWIMTYSARMTDQWGAHPMVIGHSWSTDLLTWNDLGPLNTTIGWVAESSHIVETAGKTFLFWTKCPASGSCVQWSSANSLHDTFSPAQSLVGIENWAFASEALIVEGRVLFFHIGGGIYEREAIITNGAPSLRPLELPSINMATGIRIPDVPNTEVPGIPGVSFLVYREQQGLGWNGNEDLFIGSFTTDDAGKLNAILPPGSYWFVSDEVDYLPNHPLSAYAPESFATPVAVQWAQATSLQWFVHHAPRRWNIGGTNTSIQRSVAPFTATSSTATSFTSIHDIQFVGVRMDDAVMMLSNDDGGTWWTINDGIWSQQPMSISSAVPVSVLRAHLGNFPVGNGQLRWQVFHAENAVPVTVDISLDATPVAPTQILPSNGAIMNTLRPAFTIQASDPDTSSLLYVIQYCGAVCSTVETYMSQSQWLGLVDGLAPNGVSVTWTPSRAIGNGPMQWRARAIDGGGSATWSDWSGWMSMQLPEAAQVTPSVRVISPTSIELHWVTRTPSTAYITYTDEYDHEFFTSAPVLNGMMQLSDLLSGAQYYFSITTTDLYGQQATANIFQQMPTTATSIVSSSVWSDATGVHISWQTNSASTGQVYFGHTANSIESVLDVVTGTTHTVVIPGFSAGQTVYYRIDGQGETVYTSGVQSYVLPVPDVVYEEPILQEPRPILLPPRELRRRR